MVILRHKKGVFYMEMGEIIKQLRKAQNLTQEELGERVGVQKSAIAKYENGRVENIKRSVIQAMATLFDVSPCYLMGWSDTPKPNTNNFLVNDFEKKIIIAYRQADNISKAMVQRTLNVEEVASTQSSVSRKGGELVYLFPRDKN